MALPSSRVTPLKTCPARRPRWFPHRLALAWPGLPPSTPLHGVGGTTEEEPAEPAESTSLKEATSSDA